MRCSSSNRPASGTGPSAGLLARSGLPAVLALGALLLVMPLVSLGCGDATEEGSAASSKTSTSKQRAAGHESSRFQAVLRAPTHTPKVREPWRWSVRVTTRDGRPLRTQAQLEFLFGGRVVAKTDRPRFVGSYAQTIRWPRRSAGFPLTFRVVVKTSQGTKNLDYAVQVRR